MLNRCRFIQPKNRRDFKMLSPYKSGLFEITSPYGYRTSPFSPGVKEWHGGIDLVGRQGKEICAVCGGSVAVSQMLSSGKTAEWGNYIAVLQSDNKMVYYCHLSERRVSAGQRIEKGDVIGIEGATGRVTGSHLHFEVRDLSGNQLDASEYLGIPNRASSVEVQPDYAALVAKKCGFEQKTVDYLNKYQFASDLWRKLWLNMQS